MRLITTTMAAALAGMLAITTPAAAEFSLDLGILGGENGGGFRLAINKNHYASAVRVETVAPERVWIQPVYRMTTERVWVPTVETRYRDVPVVDARGRVIEYRRETYTIKTGYWQEVPRRVMVRAGYWTTPARPMHATQICVAGGREYDIRSHAGSHGLVHGSFKKH